MVLPPSIVCRYGCLRLFPPLPLVLSSVHVSRRRFVQVSGRAHSSTLSRFRVNAEGLRIRLERREVPVEGVEVELVLCHALDRLVEMRRDGIPVERPFNRGVTTVREPVHVDDDQAVRVYAVP